MTKRAWTAEQAAAIQHRQGNLLVAAGAGSGKTAVLVERVITLLSRDEQPLDVDQLLVVTFTNAAAAEMRQRIGEALESLLRQQPENGRLKKQLALLPRASICTLHAFCLDLIRQFFYKLAMDPGLRVANEMETAMLEEDAMESVLSRRYDQGDEELQLLLTCFGNGPWDEHLREQILRISGFSRATPDPQGWLSGLAFAYQGKDDSWLDYLLVFVRQELENACQAMALALQLCRLEKGPSAYLPILEREFASLQQLVQIPDWDGLAWKLAAMEFAPRLPSIRKTERVADSLKTMVQSSRNTAKTIIKGLKEQYFASPLAEERRKMQEMQPVAEALAHLTLEYQQELDLLKRKKRLIDFQDMEHLCLALLEAEDGEVRTALQKQYRAIFVDEYQDINQVQDKIISLLASEDNLFLVGDVKQSIYRFRLADPGLFQEKFASYGQGKGGRRIDLQRNFRSAPVVLEDVNMIFGQLMSQAGAEIEYDESAVLIPGLPLETEGRVELHLLQPAQTAVEEDETIEDVGDEREAEALLEAQQEARHIGGQILTLYNQGYQYRDMVILLRSVKQDAPIFRQELTSMGIPCHGAGGNTFYESAEVSTILSLLQVIDNPRQDIHLAAVLHSPIGGFQLEELAQLRLAAPGDLYDALQASESPKATAFRQMLARWRQPGRSNRISQLLQEIYQETGFYQMAGALPEGGQRQANLLFLLNQAKEYESTSYRGLYRFLTFIKRYLENGRGTENARTLGENENVVRILSIHQSKGLEYPVVFLARMNKNFNTQDCYKDILLHKQLGLGLPYIDREKKIKYKSLIHQGIADKIYWETLAEEMRLLYVAMTRAKQRLYLVGSCRNLQGLLKNTAVTSQIAEKKLPPYLLDRGVNYITWLLRCLWRHPDGEPLRLAWFGPQQSSVVKEDLGGRLTVRFLTYEAQALEQPHIIPDWLDAVAMGKPLFLPQEEEFSKQMDWDYPYLAATAAPVKWTVTGLQRQLLTAEQEGPVIQPASFLSERDALNKGITMHYLLEHVDLAAAQPLQVLQELLQGRVEKGLCGAALAAQLDLSVVTDFLDSPLGQRCKAARQVLREQPFMLLCSTQDLQIELPSPEEALLQGTIDLAFQEDDGWILVDYKYANPKRATEADILHQYGQQLVYYRQALQQILGQPCTEGYLYFLPARRQVRVF